MKEMVNINMSRLPYYALLNRHRPVVKAYANGTP